MKKFRITDEDGREYEVEKLESEEKDIKDDDTPVEVELTSEEKTALKQLAAKVPELLKLLEVENKEHEAVAAADEDKEIETNLIKEGEEKVVDTDEIGKEKVGMTDAKKSFGSIAKNTVKDSAYDNKQNEIAEAWAKRYNGGK